MKNILKIVFVVLYGLVSIALTFGILILFLWGASEFVYTCKKSEPKEKVVYVEKIVYVKPDSSKVKALYEDIWDKNLVQEDSI